MSGEAFQITTPWAVNSTTIARWLGVSKWHVSDVRYGFAVPALDGMLHIAEVLGWPLEDQVAAYQEGRYPLHYNWRVEQYARRTYPDSRCACGCGTWCPDEKWAKGHGQRWLSERVHAACAEDGNHPAERAEVSVKAPEYLKSFDAFVAYRMKRIRASRAAGRRASRRSRATPRPGRSIGRRREARRAPGGRCGPRWGQE